jgi:hypothetical protein
MLTLCPTPLNILDQLVYFHEMWNGRGFNALPNVVLLPFLQSHDMTDVRISDVADSLEALTN